MKRIVSFIGMALVAAMLCAGAEAQVMRFKHTKTVDRSTGAEYTANNEVRCIKFSADKSSFQFTDGSGKPLPGNQYQTSWSYCNQRYSTYNNGMGGIITQPTGQWFNDRIFRYQGKENGYRKYQCRRPVVNRSNGSVIGYINDWIYFSDDYSRFSIYSGGSLTDNGYSYDADSWEIGSSGQVYVYEVIDNNPGKMLY